MLKRFVQLHSALEAVKRMEDSELQIPSRLESEILVRLLEPFERATVRFQVENKVSITNVVPEIVHLKELCSPLSTDSPFESNFKVSTERELERVFKDELCTNFDSKSNAQKVPIALLASALHPVHGKLGWLKTGKQVVQGAACQLAFESRLESHTDSSKALFSEEMKLLFRAIESHVSSATSQEFFSEATPFAAQEAMDTKRRGEDAEFETFWKMRLADHPLLRGLAERVVSVPASTASVERLFSCTGFLKPAERACMGPDTLRELTTIRIALRTEGMHTQIVKAVKEQNSNASSQASTAVLVHDSSDIE